MKLVSACFAIKFGAHSFCLIVTTKQFSDLLSYNLDFRSFTNVKIDLLASGPITSTAFREAVPFRLLPSVKQLKSLLFLFQINTLTEQANRCNCGRQPISKTENPSKNSARIPLRQTATVGLMVVLMLFFVNPGHVLKWVEKRF